MMIRCLLSLAVLAPASLVAQERYGFVAMLGRDTIAVERLSRTGDTLVSDAVERFPRVVQRHTTILLAPDQSVRHLTMDIIMPSAVTPKWHERHVTAEYFRDSIRATIRNGEGTKKVILLTNGALTMPWASQMYSLVELYFAAAMQRPGDSVAVHQFYPDAQAEEFPLHQGFVRGLPHGKAEVFHHDMLAGTGEATLDARHRMLSYSGARTTYRQEVTRVSGLPNIEAIAKGFIETERRQGPAPDLSIRDTTRATIGAASFLVDYGSPLARGRELVGNIIPYGAVWRTGANAATQFTTSAAITLAGLELAPGTYTLWTVPSRSGAELIVNRQTKQWGTQYDSTKDLGRAPLTVEALATVTEKFVIKVTAVDARRGQLVLEWGTFRWTAPIVVK